ncbi:uncharacterized protein LOC124696634 [Lolium rigidum]|uniref:uncharacterized protein LOC124696634 n=1 Tax=Lolium rigidum TaxID=89674 RepID=UPI001F5CC3E9|nr:uncharacterized protein LOC124696634 [Lolium rigidum]
MAGGFWTVGVGGDGDGSNRDPEWWEVDWGLADHQQPQVPALGRDGELFAFFSRVLAREMSWEGSFITAVDISRLRRTRRIPDGVECRLPAGEIAPAAGDNESVVFLAHFERGLGLPVSNFLRSLLDFFALQPHHLPANAFLSLSCFVAFCEAYLGLWPTVELWSRLFYFKAQVKEGELQACGAASIYPGRDFVFPKIPTAESVKKWQTGFFYAKNADPTNDLINLPAFNIAPPTGKVNWRYDPKSSDPAAEVNLMFERLKVLTNDKALSAQDLMATFVSRRVLPLQSRVHKMCHMSDWLDPTRTARRELTAAEVASRVNIISQARMPDGWKWGMEPFSREKLPPQHFTRQDVEDGPLEMKVWAADRPEEEGDADQATDDDMLLEEDVGTSSNHRKSASSHPLRDYDDDDDEVMVLEALDVVPLRIAPPTVGQVPANRKRKGAAAQQAIDQPAKKSAPTRQRRTARPKVVPEVAGAIIKFSKDGASGTPADTMSTPPPQPRRREPTHTPTSFPLPPAGSRLQGEPARTEEQPASSCQPTMEEVLRRSQPEAAAQGGAGGGGDGCLGDTPMGGVGSAQPIGPETAAPPPPEPVVRKAPEPAAAPPSTESEAKAKGEAAQPDTQLSLHVSPTGQHVATTSASAGSGLGSIDALQQEWTDAGVHEVTNRDDIVGVAPLHGFFADMRMLVSASAKEATNQLHRTEKAVVACNEKRAAVYGQALQAYKSVKDDRDALAQELHIHLATAPSSAEFKRMREELAAARGRMKELEEQDTRAVEAANSAEARIQALEAEVSQLKKGEEDLRARHQTDLDTLRLTHQGQAEELSRQLKEADAELIKVQDQHGLLTKKAAAWVVEIDKLNHAMEDCFPKLQEADVAAILAVRQEQSCPHLDDTSHFTMEDHLAAMTARLGPMETLGRELRRTANEIFAVLWPTQSLPTDLGRLVQWLETAPARIDDWRESAARAGADMALSFVLSWYEEVSLDQLEGRRAGAEKTLSAETIKRRLARACAIAEYVHIDDFISDPTKDTTLNELNFIDDDDEKGEEDGEEGEDALAEPGAGQPAAPEVPPSEAPEATPTAPVGPPPAGS